MIRLEKRPQPSRAWSWATPLVAVALTMIAGGLMFAALGKDPFEAIRTIFIDPLFGPFASYARPQLLIKAAPLILIAIGLSFGFKAGIWNIGAEGQYIMGAIFGAGLALAFYPAESRLIFPLAIAGGALGGLLWAMIPALLKVKLGTNEILVSLMLVYVAQNILASMATGLLKNPEGMGFPGSRNLAQYPAVQNLELIPGTGMHWGVLAAFLAVIAAQVIFARHQLGFQIRVTGQSPRAAAFAGVDPAASPSSAWASPARSPVSRVFRGRRSRRPDQHRLQHRLWLHRHHRGLPRPPPPIGILLAGLLMALTYIGGEMAQLALSLPAAAIQLFQGMLLFFLLAVDVLTNYRLRIAFGKAA